MKWLIVLILIGCGREETKCNLEVYGTCVWTNGYELSEERLLWELQEVETDVNRFYPGLDLYSLNSDHNLTITFVPPESMNARGLYNNGNVKVHIVDEEDSARCMETYYVMGHEVLHFVAEFYLGVSNEQNAAHNVSGIFIRGRFVDTAEYWIYVNTQTYCGYKG